MSHAREPAALFALALSLHLAWAFTVPLPVDWDPAYYREVALNIAEGRGAVTGALAFLGQAPGALPMPADLHWMPLPSRILVPLLWLWPAHGDQLTTALLGALWAPLAWALGRELAPEGGAARLAGLLAAFAGAYARFLSTPDSIALYGVLGGIGLLSVARERAGGAAVVALLAAFSRGDGWMLGLALALGLPGWGRLLPAGAGLAAAALWSLRNLGVGGEEWLVFRASAASALDYRAWVHGVAPAVGLGERLGAWPRLLGRALNTLSLSGLHLLPWAAALGAATVGWRGLTRSLVGMLAALALALLLAPAVVDSGSIFRSGASIFPAICALAAVGAQRASAWGAERRGYPAGLLSGIFLGAFAFGSLAMGAMNARAMPSRPPPCAALPSGAVLSDDPLLVAAMCRREAVLFAEDSDVEGLVLRHGVRSAWIAPRVGSLGGSAAQLEALPGWEAAGEGIYRRISPAP